MFKNCYANAMGVCYHGPSEFSFCMDPAAQAFLPSGVSESVFAGRVVADGNCFFRALSLRLFGVQVNITCRIVQVDKYELIKVINILHMF